MQHYYRKLAVNLARLTALNVLEAALNALGQWVAVGRDWAAAKGQQYLLNRRGKNGGEREGSPSNKRKNDHKRVPYCLSTEE